MIKDSGERRSFSSGAVRDIAEGKGRTDLLPLREVAELLDSRVIELLANYVETGFEGHLYDAITVFHENGSDEPLEELILDLSKHFEEGCLKYGEPKAETGYLSNWQLGIPLHCYIDSGVRHYLKHISGHTDERHDRSFVWNLLCCVWTQRNRPELIDLPFAGKKVTEVKEVKRRAQIGEWIKVVECVDRRYQNGDVFKVIEDACFGSIVRISSGYRVSVLESEYVVLEGYEPEKGATNEVL